MPLPKRTIIKGQKHELAYINKDEKALLRSRGGGVTKGGGQLKHKGINAYRPGSPGATSGQGSAAGTSGGADGAGGGPGAGSGPGSGAAGQGASINPFLLKKVIVAAPPLASAATISDPTTSEDVQAGLRRDAAADRNPVTTTDPGPGPAPAAKQISGPAAAATQFTGSLGDTQSATLKLLGSP